MVHVVYLEMLETTMRILGIQEEKSMILSPSHIGGKRNMYTKSDELDTTEFDKMDVVNKEMVTANCCQKLVMKNQGQRITLWIINYKNDYKRTIIKGCYKRIDTKASCYNLNGQNGYNHF